MVGNHTSGIFHEIGRQACQQRTVHAADALQRPSNLTPVRLEILPCALTKSSSLKLALTKC